MISSAQALSTPRRRRVLMHTTTWSGSAFPTRFNPKTVIAVSSVSVIVLAVLVLTHLGTYNITMLHLPAQTNVQSSVVTYHPAKTTVQPATSSINASQALVRVDQTSVSQYTSQAQHDLWSPSTCSAASLTEAIDSYGHQYKIADILKVESGIGAITADQGLLYPSGIDDTAAKFGFSTQTLADPTLSQVLTIANNGKPVIVNFPPETWAGGHFLVVVGGTTIDGVQYVHLADSSKLNMQYMKVGAITQWGTFLYYWRGLAKVLSPNTPVASAYSVIGKPTLSASFINQVFTAYQSPAQGKGQALYDLGMRYGIDPAFALAFFLHESTLGTAGEAQTTLSLGNLRCIKDAACINQAGTTCQTGQSCYAAFPTWDAGFQAWYALIAQGYVQGGINQTIGKNACPCTTVGQIIPIYAPASDHNDEQAYIDSLTHSLDVWHSGQLKP